MDMEVTELDGGVTCVRLQGRLDAAGADRIGVRFTAAVVSQGRPAAVDLGGVSFVASMGLRLLIGSAKALRLKGMPLALFGATGPVQEVLEQASLDQIIPVCASQSEAVERLAA